MDRIEGLNQTSIDTLRAELEGRYPNNEKPCPGTPLQNDDDIMYLEVLPMRVLWGTDDADFFNAYAPDLFGEIPANLDAHYITDRAPADSNETPMPIYPQQQQQRQHGKKHDPKAALHHLLKQLDHEHAQKVRALVKQKRPELLEGDKP